MNEVTLCHPTTGKPAPATADPKLIKSLEHLGFYECSDKAPVEPTHSAPQAIQPTQPVTAEVSQPVPARLPSVGSELGLTEVVMIAVLMIAVLVFGWVFFGKEEPWK